MIATSTIDSNPPVDGKYEAAGTTGSPFPKGPLPEDREGLLGCVRAAFPDLQAAEDAFEVPTWFPRQTCWVEDPVGSETVVYNFPLLYRIRGPLDPAALRRGLGEVVRRHGVFRSVFRILEGRLIQVVLPPRELEVAETHPEGTPEEQEQQLQVRVRVESMRPFDLTRDAILRCNLFRLAPDHWVLLLVTHTLVFDDWSSGVLIHELSEVYGALAAGGSPAGLDLPFSFGDFVRWQRPRFQGPDLEPHLEFWRRQLVSKNGFEHLSPDFPRPARKTYEGAKLSVTLPEAQVNALLAMSRQEHVSLYAVLLSGFKCVLHDYTGNEEIGIGSCAANRQLEEVEGLIGRFGNSALLKTSLAGNPTFSELFRRVQEVTLDALSHLEVPYGMLMEMIGGSARSGRPPSFQTMFILQNAPKDTWHLPRLRVELSPLETPTSKLDLIVWLKTEPNLEITLEYATQVFAPSTMKKLLADYKSMLATLAGDPKRRIKDSPGSARREPEAANVESVSANGTAPAADTSDVKRRMTGIWENVFRPRAVDLTKNFFESGGDSLLAVRLFSQINREFQCRMPLSTLWGAPTIDQLAQVVAALSSLPSSSLVPIQPRGSRPPLFFVHGSGGEPMGGVELSRSLGPDQPVYGLRSRSLCGGAAQRSVPEMAQYYVTCIRDIQPKGPYYLSGFCFGGLVAYEMARFLKSQNEDVALVAVFDSPAPGSLRLIDCFRNRVRHDFWRLRQGKLPSSFPILATKSRRAIRSVLMAFAAVLRGMAGKDAKMASKGLEQEMLEVSKTNIAAAKSYRPGVYSGPLALFYTPEAFALYGNDQHERWQAFGAGGVELHRTEGLHLRQLDAPYVGTLTKKLEDCMAQAAAPKQGPPFQAHKERGAPAHSGEPSERPGSLAVR